MASQLSAHEGKVGNERQTEDQVDDALAETASADYLPESDDEEHGSQDGGCDHAELRESFGQRLPVGRRAEDFRCAW